MMNRHVYFKSLCAVLFGLSALAAGDEKKDEKPPAGLPDTTESVKLADKMPKIVSGTVFFSTRRAWRVCG